MWIQRDWAAKTELTSWGISRVRGQCCACQSLQGSRYLALLNLTLCENASSNSLLTQLGVCKNANFGQLRQPQGQTTLVISSFRLLALLIKRKKNNKPFRLKPIP